VSPLRSRSPAMRSGVAPAEAASLAAAQYVHGTAYASGVADGWAAGWADAVADAQASSSAAATPSPRPPADADGLAAEEPTAQPLFELSPLWAALFAAGEERRRREARRRPGGGRGDVDGGGSGAGVGRARGGGMADLGGEAEAARLARAGKLYGARRDEVLAAGAEIGARFAEAQAGECAPLWPVVGLRDLC
jgi:hypothetical protein